jgi:hypothetical protein
MSSHDYTSFEFDPMGTKSHDREALDDPDPDASSRSGPADDAAAPEFPPHKAGKFEQMAIERQAEHDARLGRPSADASGRSGGRRARAPGAGGRTDVAVEVLVGRRPDAGRPEAADGDGELDFSEEERREDAVYDADVRSSAGAGGPAEDAATGLVVRPVDRPPTPARLPPGAACPPAQDLGEDARRALMRAYQRGRNAFGLVDARSAPHIVAEAGIAVDDDSGASARRLRELAAHLDEGRGLTFEHLWALARNKTTIAMLNQLFHEHHEGDDGMREPSLSVEGVDRILRKLYFPVEARALRSAFDRVDAARTGTLFWEEMLTLCQALMRESGVIERGRAGKGDSRAVRENVARMRARLAQTREETQELEAVVRKKQGELAGQLGDRTHAELKERLRQFWDVKDQIELAIMNLKIKHFDGMRALLSKNDKAKQRMRDAHRDEVMRRADALDRTARARRLFRNDLESHFLSFPVLAQTMRFIQEAAGRADKGVAAAQAAAEACAAQRARVRDAERPPAPSSSAECRQFLRRQRSVLGEISEKMRAMQQERDRYERMIEEEVAQNKEKRIAICVLNQRVTELEATQLLLERGAKDERIQRQTLRHAVAVHKGDVESAKVKQLRATVRMFEAEAEEVDGETRRTRARLAETEARIVAARERRRTLNVELGELKILLQGVKDRAAGIVGAVGRD